MRALIEEQQRTYIAALEEELTRVKARNEELLTFKFRGDIRMRRIVLEEAARVADSAAFNWSSIDEQAAQACRSLARHIRALKGKRSISGAIRNARATVDNDGGPA